MNADRPQIVRKVWGSGRWFPGNSKQLKAMVNGYMDAAEIETPEMRIVAAIAPHAGYVYSGPVAGYTFRALRDCAGTDAEPDTVVIIGFSHREAFRGVALMDGDAIETPLGQTPLDVDTGRALASSSDRIAFNYQPHAGEHSAENEIPFVQAALPRAAVVVGIIGDHDAQTLVDLVSALNQVAAHKNITVIASTDLLHDADYDRVTTTDKRTLEMIVSLEDKELLQHWDYGNQLCCGIGPVLTAMRFAKAQGCRQGRLLRYRNSGDDHPESRGNWVVGYGAVVFTAAGTKTK